jgi:hypothetical protein
MNKNLANNIEQKGKRIDETFVGMVPMHMLFIHGRIDLLLVCLPMWRREQNDRIMVLLFIVFIFIFPAQIKGVNKEIIVESPFYLRARIHDTQTASVLFEIALENNQRTCQMYKFTIRRNSEYPYSMSEQNLTFWRNSLELKHLAVGHYKVCAIICSEHLRSPKFHYEFNEKRNRTTPITACVQFDAFRPHLLVLTLYILVFIFLTISQVMFSLRKRQVQARIKMALIELENTVQKWRTNTETSGDHMQSYTILQSLITLPASPVEHSSSQPHLIEDEQHPIIFHLDSLNEHL